MTETLSGAKLWPQSGSMGITKKGTLGKACTPAKGKVLPASACRSEILFVGPTVAKQAGTAPGPHIRFCVAQGKPGPLFPVQSPEQAKQLGDEFCRQVRGKQESERQEIATSIATREKSPALGARRSLGAFGPRTEEQIREQTLYAARAAEAKIAEIAKTRRPTDEEAREARYAYAQAAVASYRPGQKLRLTEPARPGGRAKDMTIEVTVVGRAPTGLRVARVQDGKRFTVTYRAIRDELVIFEQA